jgi:hypothetical protein
VGVALGTKITVEPLDPLWSETVGPYGSTSQVNPSGKFQPITVNVTLGGDVQQDIVMPGSAVQSRLWYGPPSYALPALLPANGNWAGALNSYGAVDFFEFNAQANRTLSVIVNALDESGNLSENKLLPFRGDVRPDYRYNARVLYGDSVLRRARVAPETQC